jgi:hypothetical protein
MFPVTLDLHSTVHGIHHTGKVGQEVVPWRVLIVSHEKAVACDIGT